MGTTFLLWGAPCSKMLLAEHSACAGSVCHVSCFLGCRFVWLRCLWRITIGPSLTESLLETCIAAYLFTPCVLVCFCLLTLGLSSDGRLGCDIFCTVDFAAPALASSSKASLHTSLLCPYTCIIDTDATLVCHD